jgi:hypothetical protein
MPTSPRRGMRSVSSAGARPQLQRELGELGEVLPYMFRAVGECKAPGWYARVDGELVYLGGHFVMACQAIGKLLEERR